MNKIKILIPALLIGTSFVSTFASSPRYMALADSADNYIKEEKWNLAEKTILDALRLEPANFSNALLLSNLGVVRTQRGDYPQALEAFRLGISIAPETAVIYTNRARTYLHLGQYDDALADLNKSLSLDSVKEWPLQTRGFLLLNKDPEGAKKDFLLLSRLYPSNATAMSGLAALAEKEGDQKEALRYYDEAIAIKDDPATRFSRILLKINMNNFNDASEDISSAISLFPDDGDLYILRGYLHKLRFQNDAALADKKIAIDKGADKEMIDQFLP